MVQIDSYRREKLDDLHRKEQLDRNDLIQMQDIFDEFSRYVNHKLYTDGDVFEMIYNTYPTFIELYDESSLMTIKI